MKISTMSKVLHTLQQESKHWDVPVVTLIAITGKHPYRVLISCILSLRTNDKTTSEAVKRLFAVADNPVDMMKVSNAALEKLIYPVGFYRNKAKLMHSLSKDVLERFGGKVPDDMDALISMKGVGRKTANLVLSEGFKKPAICVDVHVHRINNRLGFLNTKTPEETEFGLREKLPKKYWSIINSVLVAFGQHHCRPISPHCSNCKVAQWCKRVGVTQSR